MSDISHYESRTTEGIERAITIPSEDFIGYYGSNIFVKGLVGDEVNDEDVSDRFSLLASGAGLHSRLAWHDTLRNVRVFEEIADDEPICVLDIGCGESHPLGRFIHAQELDTHYIGMDPVENRARVVAKDEEGAPRSFVGVHHDVRNGIPMHDDTVDFVACLAAVTQWVHSVDDMNIFLGEVARVAKPGSPFWLSTPNTGGDDKPLQHPHCHVFEFSDEVLVNTFTNAGFKVQQRFNYRARPSELFKLRDRHNHELYQNLYEATFGWPTALADGFLLPFMTWNDPVPGNVLYRVDTPRV